MHDLSLKFVVHKNKKPKKINVILIGNLKVLKNWYVCIFFISIFLDLVKYL